MQNPAYPVERFVLWHIGNIFAAFDLYYWRRIVSFGEKVNDYLERC
jgi:hypothetical protein